MRNKLAKKLKKKVAIEMYVGDDVTEQDVLDDRKSVYKSSDFKAVYRARKKNHLRTTQYPKLKGSKRQFRKALQRRPINQ